MPFVLRRVAARVMCFNASGEILMIRAHDPARPDEPSWWEIPGGGIEHGETSEHAVERELHEEAGLGQVRIGPVVAHLRARFTFAGWRFDQNEVIHVAWADDDRLGATRLEAFEAMAFEECRWWAVDELMNGSERTVPPRLRDALAQVADGTLPDTPIDITDHEANAAAWPEDQ